MEYDQFLKGFSDRSFMIMTWQSIRWPQDIPGIPWLGHCAAVATDLNSFLMGSTTPPFGFSKEKGEYPNMGLSENRVYSQWNSHLIGIMISKTIGFRGTQHFQTHPYVAKDSNCNKENDVQLFERAEPWTIPPHPISLYIVHRLWAHVPQPASVCQGAWSLGDSARNDASEIPLERKAYTHVYLCWILHVWSFLGLCVLVR